MLFDLQWIWLPSLSVGTYIVNRGVLPPWQTRTGKSASSYRLNLSNVFLSPPLHIHSFHSWVKKVLHPFPALRQKKGNVNTGCGTHRARWRWWPLTPSSWSPRGQSRRPRSRRSRCWLPLSLSCSAHSWQSTGQWIRRWIWEICSLLDGERKIDVLAKSTEGKGAGKDTEPRGDDVGRNRWGHLTVAGNLERGFVPVPSDVGLREAVFHLARGDLREAEGGEVGGERIQRAEDAEHSKSSLNTNESLLTLGLSSMVVIPVRTASIVGWLGVTEKKVRK